MHLQIQIFNKDITKILYKITLTKKIIVGICPTHSQYNLTMPYEDQR